MKILITGSRGMLGKDLVSTFKASDHEVLATDRGELDITTLIDVLNFVEKEKPDLIINAAAYNFVDRVEDQSMYPEAFAINASGPKYLAHAAADVGIPFVHFSTDYVFDGTKREGYTESDTPCAISKYGETKLCGERFVQEQDHMYYICRLSKIFGISGEGEGTKKSFVEKMIELSETKSELDIVDDEVGCPSYTVDIAQAVLKLVTGEYAPGIYHLINEGGGVTWFEFAKEIFEVLGKDIKLNPVPSYERPAPRPKYAELKNTKFPKLRSRKEALRDFLK